MHNTSWIVFHRALLDEESSWWRMSVTEQLANIGTEIGRCVTARVSGDTERFDGAIRRADELFALAVSDPRWHRTPRLQEILRTREIVYDHWFGDDAYGETDTSLDRYFLAFAMTANEERRKRCAVPS